MYFIISASCDGISVDQIDESELKKRFNERDPYYGKSKVLDAFPKERDPNYWGESVIVIKGEVVDSKLVRAR